jgi:hypothetical protein
MATFLNPLNRAWLSAAVERRPTKPSIKQSYIGTRFFPYLSVYDYTVLWDIVTASNRLAGVYDHNGVPIPGNESSFTQAMADILNVMASRVIDTETVMKLRDVGEIGVTNNLTRAVREKYLGEVTKKIGYCDDEVEATIEYLCLEVLQGTVHWPPRAASGAVIPLRPAYWGDVNFTLNMGFRAAFMQAATTLVGYGGRVGGHLPWTNAAATPLVDLGVISQYVQEVTGIQMHGAEIITSRIILDYLCQNATILDWFRNYNFNGSNIQYVDEFVLKDALKTKLGWNITLYDAQFTYEDQATLGQVGGPTEQRIRFLPEGVMIILPPGVMGDGNANLMTAPDPGPDNQWQTGKYTWTHRIPTPPWTTEVGVGIHAFPILKEPQDIFVFDAYH